MKMTVVPYKEITPYPDSLVRWQDLTVNAGASQSTLQDIKLPESAGCFAYSDSGALSSSTSNRFIYWRTSNDVIEFVEVSLDVNLKGNHARLRFQHTPVLQGISFHETHDQVIILIATVSTIHRLCLPHPRKLQGKEYLVLKTNKILPSIFDDISLANVRDQSNYCILNHASVGVPLPHTSCSWLAPNGDAAFLLANSVGSMLLVVMSTAGKITTVDLKKTSVMTRLWSNIVPVTMRNNQGDDAALSIISHRCGEDVLIFALCYDLRVRMWSYNKQECLMSASVLEYCGQTADGTSQTFTAPHCSLRKSVDSSSSTLYLGIFVSFPQQKQFCILQPLFINDLYVLSHITTVNSPQYDLVDYCLSMSQIWTLCLNSQSEPVMKVIDIEKCGPGSESDEQSPIEAHWQSVDLHPPVQRDVYINLELMDSREAYLKEIFYPGRFSPTIITKVIMIYKRAGDVSLNSSLMQEAKTLKEEAIKAVESEIQTKAAETDLTDEAYQELQRECWERFFSYCVQYHEVDTKSVGISLDPATGCVIIVKKNMYSLIRPCDIVEQLVLSRLDQSSDSTTLENSHAIVEFGRDDPELSASLMGIVQCLDMLSNTLTDEMLRAFDHDLFYLKSPEDIAAQIVKELSGLYGDSEALEDPDLPTKCLLTKMQAGIQATPDLVSALYQLLKWMDVGLRAELYDISDYEVPHYTTYNSFLSGASGISILCEGVRQFAEGRFAFCRNLIIYESFVAHLEEMGYINVEWCEKISTEILPCTAQLVRAYFAIMWCNECECLPVQPEVLESGVQQLSLLELPDSTGFFKGDKGFSLRSTIVHLFLSEQGGSQARNLLSIHCSTEESMGNNWSSLFPTLISSALHLLWPLGPHFLFPEFLLTQCQYLPLQGYARLVGKWCDWNRHSLKFLCANSHLTLAEHVKARELFCDVVSGLETEEFLRMKIMQGADTSIASLSSHYYMKVIQLFEYFDLSEMIVSLAARAIDSIEKSDPYVPVFWSLVFKHHLELGHYDDAYAAMIQTPDPSRKKDCLRQLIVVLCDRKRYKKLISFPYAEMLDDVIMILESRARTCDLMRQNYYDLLYAFHVHNNNFRKAATLYYEYGMRLGQEVCSLVSLRKQVSCYLSTINALHLVEPQYAWIVKPVPRTSTPEEVEDCSVNASPKRNSDGDEIQSKASTQKVQVLDLEDIRREYQLINARLLLVERDLSSTSIAATPLSASDTVTLLVNAGFFDVAISLCKAFKLTETPVFEGLTYRCVVMVQCPKSKHNTDDDAEAIRWLSQNDTTVLPTSTYISANDQVWYLLKNYLEQYELPSQTCFHRCVAIKLLSVGVHLPAWFRRSYQRRNAAELLWLYISHGLLESATDLAVDYIDAVLGYGTEDFGLTHSLHVNSPPVWLPHTYLDALLDALSEIQSNCSDTPMLYKRLTRKLEDYNNAVDTVTENKIIMAHRHTSSG